MHAFIRSGFLGIVLVAAVGCGGGGTESVQTIDGITITVRLPRGRGMEETGRTAGGVVTWKSGDLEYVLDNGNLKVNGKDYGHLKKGDEVLIEPPQRVVINGEERQPNKAP